MSDNHTNQVARAGGGALRANESAGQVQATQADLLDVWRLSGGTILPGGNGEYGYMVVPKLLVFLRRMVEAARTVTPVALALTGDEVEAFREWRKIQDQEKRERGAARDVLDVEAVEVPASADESRLKPAAALLAPPPSPAAPAANVAPYARALMRLIAAAAPGLQESDNILEDAERVAATFGQAELAGYFVQEDVEGVKVHTEVGDEHAHEADVFPLFRRAAIVAAPAPAPAAGDDAQDAPAAAPAPAGRRKGSKS